MSEHVIDQWHQLFEAGDLQQLKALLADDAVFHSPVLHKPQEGGQKVFMYLAAAFKLLNNGHFEYLRRFDGEQQAVLEFVTEIDGITINGVDIIHWNAQGKIDDFKVLLRPLKAIQLVQEKMAAELAKS